MTLVLGDRIRAQIARVNAIERHTEQAYLVCPACGDVGEELGTLGRRLYRRCRACGIDFSREAVADAQGVE